MKMGGGFKWFMTMGAESGISGVENPHHNNRELFISTAHKVCKISLWYNATKL